MTFCKRKRAARISIGVDGENPKRSKIFQIFAGDNESNNNVVDIGASMDTTIEFLESQSYEFVRKHSQSENKIIETHCDGSDSLRVQNLSCSNWNVSTVTTPPTPELIELGERCNPDIFTPSKDFRGKEHDSRRPSKFCIGSVYLNVASSSLRNEKSRQPVHIVELESSTHISVGKLTSLSYAGSLIPEHESVLRGLTDEFAIVYDTYCPEASVLEEGQDGLWIALDLYCPSENKIAAGRYLARNKVYLENPYMNKSGLPYSNPHIFIASDETENYTCVSTSRKAKNPKLEEFEAFNRQNEISDLFTVSSHQSKELLSTKFEFRTSNRIKTDLILHQQEGLTWMLNKEGWLGSNKNSSKGGILADDMGMGKTLTTLALILTASDLSRTLSRSNTTLIVSPKSVVTAWEEQIKKHTIDLKYLIYDPIEWKDRQPGFQEYDVVVTTYGIIAHRSSKSSRQISSFGWRRIILDEAHTIRERSTKQAKAMFALKSDYRWCLTGTPVQNKLDDYGSLLQFIEHEDFGTRAKFNSAIIKSLKANDKQSLANLKQLICDTTLRRLKYGSNLDLPEKMDQILELQFSEEEARLNKLLEAFVANKIQELIRTGQSTKSHMYHMQLILRLRQACNHGLDLLPPSIQNQLRELDEEGGSEFAISKTFEEILCEICKEKASIAAEDLRIFDDCQHTVCKKCNTDDDVCPLCRVARQETISSHLKPSTKVKALIEALKSEYNVKSVIFSCWTKMLDLVEKGLERNNISYTRIEGCLTMKERRNRLDRFRNDPNCIVFLSTIGSGSTGLDLTVASRVHLLEPQFNPMLEEQALARVYRIGQTKPVTTIRYIMKGSYEEQILKRQQQKLRLAELCSSGTIKADGPVPEYLQCLEAVIK